VTRRQFRALASGLIELGNIVFGASVVALLFTPGTWPPWHAMLALIGGGLVLGGFLYWAALDILGRAGE
jgi:hypothetical protein